MMIVTTNTVKDKIDHDNSRASLKCPLIYGCEHDDIFLPIIENGVCTKR